VPTKESVRRELSELTQLTDDVAPATDGPHPTQSVAWDDSVAPPPPRRIDATVLPAVVLVTVAAPGVATPASPATVDLNAANLEQLDTLPGIGPVLAQRIVDWRTANGGFSSVDQLREVSGIGEPTVNR